MEMKWIKTFIVTAKYENFRKTAEELFLTQPAVTKHIKRLEESLNIELFERIGNKVVLTPAGHRFLGYAKEMVAKYEEGMEDFESWKQGYNRKLTIATAPQIASSFLPSLLRSFMDENPDIEVIINILKSYDVGGEISKGRADIGLTRSHPIQTNINSKIIYEEPVILVGPSECTKRSSLNEETILQKYRLLTHNHPEYWDDLLHEVQRYYPTVRTMVVNQVEVTKRFIEEGLGASYLPRTMVAEELKNNKLTEINSEKIIPPKSSTYLLTKIETEEVIKFIKFVKRPYLGFSNIHS
ncbi:transcriptional regulator [Schinkia azotoformans MEV2011]|uniref:Transcriptional regulator n=1 Tax=Schinkia azotoformans MEV2011 TaxID=1348973 RepID=A0A072NIP6_SCHAZ|nr:LysR family transcriptional regulator [Schinkia azotoformans]KEF36768.1 transcriptional regulator [Schinkia azotoformans MEV2011]MEC1698211.1 LysR family transcriptional regulator [Schinkia azotoformans]MEC1717998.1 LysR family transcriptional regulator [Schinkia azotoformans]MEC1725196.1 LysR family transcriptional regulator [Schinkia azotoformans]MEC1739663.1 LysR family transcriptional regulator [Schinkia azotoformans]